MYEFSTNRRQGKWLKPIDIWCKHIDNTQHSQTETALVNKLNFCCIQHTNTISGSIEFSFSIRAPSNRNNKLSSHYKCALGNSTIWPGVFQAAGSGCLSTYQSGENLVTPNSGLFAGFRPEASANKWCVLKQQHTIQVSSFYLSDDC